MTLRQQPLNNYMVAERVGLLIHGVRAGDGAAISTAFGPCEVLAPLWDWTEAEVFAEIEAQGIELPEHYNEVTSSLDCWNCTAEVSPARFAWMRRRYPKLADALAPVMAANLEASGALLRDYQDALRAITGEAAHA
jgi:hypothetical protein